MKVQKTKYVLFVFMSKTTRLSVPKNLSKCIKKPIYMSKNKNEDQSSLRPSLAPFSFKLFFLF